jgi:hypothetical protein
MLMVEWEIAEYGKRYKTVDAPGPWGQWELSHSEDDNLYNLKAASRPGVTKISAQHGLYYALDLAGEFISALAAE